MSIDDNSRKYSLKDEALLNIIPDVLLMINDEGLVVDYRIDDPENLVIPLENIVNRSIDQLLPADYAAEAEKILEKVFDKGETEIFEFELPFEEEINYYESRILRFSQELALAIVRNITDKKNMEQQLKEEAERFKTFIKVSNTGAWQYDRESDYLWCSREYFTMLGRKREEFDFSGKPNLQETWIDLIHPEDKEQASRAFARYLESGSSGMYENTFRMRDSQGGWVWILSRGSAIPDEKGRPSNKIVGTHIDITELKSAQQQVMEQKNIVQQLHQTALLLSDCQSEEEALEVTIEAAENILDFNLCDISLVEDDLIVTKATSAAAAVETKMEVPITEGLAGRTLETGESYLVNNLEKNSYARPASSKYKSALSLPIKNFGVFQAVATSKNAFTRQDLELSELLIAHMTTALEQIRYKRGIVYKSYHDELTDTYNRRFFEEELNRLDTERQLPLSIIMTDLNGLKIINDSYGHNQGDQVIQAAAELMQDILRSEDILARFGGDEFAILLPRTSREEALKIVDRIEESCKKTRDCTFPVSLGIGVATKTNSQEEIEEILKKADNNMYQNKLLTSRNTKSRVVNGLLDNLHQQSDETEEHLGRLKELSHKFGGKLGLSEKETKRLELLANLHDIGKSSIPSHIFFKKSPLTEKEWDYIREHSEKGFRIASATEEYAPISREILSHHERWDGRGYPNGLAGEEIPYLARIFAILDAYEVMTGDHTRGRRFSREEALAEIERLAGSQFDPELVERFTAIMRIYD